MKRFLIRALDAEKDEKILESIVRYEDEIFGEGSIRAWTIQPFARYGRICALLLEEDGRGTRVSVVGVIRSFELEKAYIYGVFTVNKYGRQGYARTLLEHVLESLKDIGITLIELTVKVENKNADSLYRKLGFETAEILKDEYGDGYPRYLMRYTVRK